MNGMFRVEYYVHFAILVIKQNEAAGVISGRTYKQQYRP